MWLATAFPVIALGVARAISVATRNWPQARRLTACVAVLLALALLDQALRVQPEPRFDVESLAKSVAEGTRTGDVVVFTPATIGDAVRLSSDDGIDVRSVVATTGQELQRARRVFVVAMFAFDNGASTERTVTLVRELSSRRQLVEERADDETKVWVFE
jgi:hypothetical protein